MARAAIEKWVHVFNPQGEGLLSGPKGKIDKVIKTQRKNANWRKYHRILEGVKDDPRPVLFRNFKKGDVYIYSQIPEQACMPTFLIFNTDGWIVHRSPFDWVGKTQPWPDHADTNIRVAEIKPNYLGYEFTPLRICHPHFIGDHPCTQPMPGSMMNQFEEALAEVAGQMKRTYDKNVADLQAVISLVRVPKPDFCQGE